MSPWVEVAPGIHVRHVADDRLQVIKEASGYGFEVGDVSLDGYILIGTVDSVVRAQWLAGRALES